jgi:hypothetical protein
MGWTLIGSPQTASGSTQIDFAIDGTYDEIMFVVTHYKPATDEQELEWQVITDNDSGYDRGIQSNNYNIYQRRDDAGSGMEFYGGSPWWQDSSDALTQAFLGGEGSGSSGTGGNGAQMAASGELIIYRPQETAHWKHFNGRQGNVYTGNGATSQTASYPIFTSGYIKEAEALTGIRFNTRSGNISVGTFSMYGLS